jgi:nickel superoxide dismutase
MKLLSSARHLGGGSLLVALILATNAGTALAHCQIPCGIYGDEMRFDMIDEHLETIGKSMATIDELSANPGENANQLTRWIMNKEDHARQLRDILTVYFLDQRIKPVTADEGDEYEKYVAQLTTVHAMMVHVMKCKQTTDTAHVQALRELSAQFYGLYFGEGHERHRH